MAHVRRKFVDIYAETKSPQAWETMQRIAALYAVEASIRGEPAEIRLKVAHVHLPHGSATARMAASLSDARGR